MYCVVVTSMYLATIIPCCCYRTIFEHNRESPLAMYIFTSEEDIQNLFINTTRSGGILLNDTIMHYAGKTKKKNTITIL